MTKVTAVHYEITCAVSIGTNHVCCTDAYLCHHWNYPKNSIRR